MAIKNIVAPLTLIIVFLGCASTWRIDKNKATAVETPDSTLWYLASLEQLKRAPQNYHMLYVGSYNSYHLIYFQSKVYGPDYFALANNDFAPSQEFEYQGLKGSLKAAQFLFRDN